MVAAVATTSEACSVFQNAAISSMSASGVAVGVAKEPGSAPVARTDRSSGVVELAIADES